LREGGGEEKRRDERKRIRKKQKRERERGRVNEASVHQIKGRFLFFSLLLSQFFWTFSVRKRLKTSWTLQDFTC
jgi:hypothetical protein